MIKQNNKKKRSDNCTIDVMIKRTIFTVSTKQYNLGRVANFSDPQTFFIFQY